MAVEPPGTPMRTDGLVRTVVVARPLDDVVQLVTLLEQSPDGLPTAASVLRVAAVARSVEDVSRLVELLGPPERGVDRMGEVVRTAAEQRPVAEAGRLVALLHAAPNAAHAEAQAVHATATGRPVEGLAQLIGGIGEMRWKAVRSPRNGDVRGARRSGVVSRGGPADLLWLRRSVAVLVLLCGAAHFPLDWVDTPRHGLAASLGISALCLPAGAALWFSRSKAVAAAAVPAPAVLAAAHLLGAYTDSPALAYVREAGGAVAPLPALAAFVATLAVLALPAVSLARRGCVTGASDTVPGPAPTVNSRRS